MYVIVKLSGKSMNGNDFDVLGGMMETELPLDKPLDLFHHLYAELKEEANIDIQDISENMLRGIVQTQRGHVLFHFDIKLNVTAKELKERFDTNTKDPDIEDLMFLSKEEYVSYLKGCGRASKEVLVGFV